MCVCVCVGGWVGGWVGVGGCGCVGVGVGGWVSVCGWVCGCVGVGVGEISKYFVTRSMFKNALCSVNMQCVHVLCERG